MGLNGANSAIQRLLGEKFYPRSPRGLQLALTIALTMTLALSGCQEESGSSKKLSSPVNVENLSAINIANVGHYGLAGSCRDVEGKLRVSLINESSSQEVTSDSLDCSNKGAWTVALDASSLNEGTIKVVVRHEDALENIHEYPQGEVMKDVTAPLAPTMTSASKINHNNFKQYGLGGSCGEEGQVVGVELRDSATTANVARPESDAICSSGAWSAKINTTNLSDGVIRLILSLKDIAGNPVTATIASKKDIVLPSIEATTFKSYIIASTQADYALSGTCSEAQREVTVRVVKPSDAASAVTPLSQPRCQGNNSWTTTVNATTLPEGPLAIIVSHQDDVGNEQTHSLTVTKDTVVPDLAVNALDAINAETSETTLRTFPIRGTCSEGDRVITVSLRDAVGHSVSPSGVVTCPTLGGNWSTQLNAISLANGTVTVSAQYRDVAGNVRVAASQELEKDTGLPTASISEGTSNILAATQTSYSVSGACSEDGRDVRVTLADDSQALSPSTPVACSSQQWTANFDASALSEGSVKISVTTQSSSGKNSVLVTKSVIKDVIPPATLLFSSDPLPAVNARNVSAYSLSGTCSEGERAITVILTDSAAAVASPSGAVTCPTSGGSWLAQLDASSLAEGRLTASAQYSDVAGNVKKATPRMVEKDTQLPTVGISESPPNILATNQASYSVSGICSENGRNVTVTLADGNKTLSPSAPVSCDSHQWTAGLDVSSLAEGKVTIAAAMQDSSGNASAEVVKSIVKDVTLPTLALSQDPLPVINVSNLSAYALSGTCSEQGQEVTVQVANRDGGGALSNQVSIATQPSCGGNGQWSLQVNASGLADTVGKTGHVISITITHRDQVSNSALLSVSTTKDSTLPTVQITTFAPYIVASTQAAYTLSGTCSEAQREVKVSLANPSNAATAATPSTQPRCQENNTWTTKINASALPQGSLAIAVGHKDSFENEQTHNQTVTKDTIVPDLAINALDVINAATPGATLSAYPVTGTCSEEGREITLTLTDSAGSTASPNGTVTCLIPGGRWSAQLDVAALAKGTLIASARYSDAAGNVKVAVPQEVEKNTQLPTASISESALNILLTTQASYGVSGACSEDGQNVTVTLSGGSQTLSPNAAVSCSSNQWDGEL